MTRVLKKILKDSCFFICEIFALVRVRIGLSPRPIVTSRLALEQWAAYVNTLGSPTKGKIAVFAIRNERWVEWAVFSACFLLKLGYSPLVVFSQKDIDAIYSRRRIREVFGLCFWQAARKRLAINFVDLDDYLPKDTIDSVRYAGFSKKIAPIVAAYDLKVEEYDESEEYLQKKKEAEMMLASYAAALEIFFSKHHPVRVVCFSGLIGISPAVLELTRQSGIPSVFVEGWAMRPGHNIWGYDRPALDFDIERWKQAIGPWDEKKETEFQEYRRFREGERVEKESWLENFHQVQRSPKLITLPGFVLSFLGKPGRCFLLGTNVVGDSASLGKSSIFRNQREWIEAVVAFFKDHKNLKLIVRAHPDEIWQKSRLRIGAVAQAAAFGADNIIVITSDQDVNTFALMDRADSGLAWVSNFGLDMALRGKPVILAAKAQYAYTGMCAVPNDRDDYFRMIREFDLLPKPSPENEMEAKFYQYIVFKRMSLQSDSPSYRGRDYRLEPEPMHLEQDIFYRILAGEMIIR